MTSMEVCTMDIDMHASHLQQTCRFVGPLHAIKIECNRPIIYNVTNPYQSIME